LHYSGISVVVTLKFFSICREAEEKLEQSQKMVIEKEQNLQKCKEECIKLKVDLLEQSKQGKRYVGSFCLLTLQCCG
jgi:hypothetical protein